MKEYIPNIYSKNIYTIDYKKLKKTKLLLFDLDNTVIKAHEKNASKKTKDLFDKLKKQGFKIVLFSNSPKKRVKKVAEYLDIDYNYFSLKPLKYSFNKMKKKYNLKYSEMAIIGDQLLTDIIGGNKLGVKTILVDPISLKDGIFTILNRKKENKILSKLQDKNMFKKGRYYD